MPHLDILIQWEIYISIMPISTFYMISIKYVNTIIGIWHDQIDDYIISIF